MANGLTLTHWGAYRVETDGRDVTDVRPFPSDPDPSPIGRSLEAVRRNRVTRPAIRRGWLEGGPGHAGERRGADPFVEVSWDEALDRVAAEIDRVRTTHGNEAIYGGSYGWASAGRFHHAQSHIHRFLSMAGGYVSSVNTYSEAAGEVIVPHVIGKSYAQVENEATSWPVIAEHTDLFVAFGGVPRKNAQVQNGGQGRHSLRDWLDGARSRGMRIVSISPLLDDVDEPDDWIPIRPNTDVALILGLIHTLAAEGLADDEFLARYATGWDRFGAYVAGDVDGTPKDADWAAGITEIPADRIRALARDMARHRTMIGGSRSIQRADHGEQAHWAIIALAAVLGQIGLPGGGFGLSYGAVGSIGNGLPRVPLPRIGRPPNQVDAFIPVARIADMLLSPGEPFDYDGRTLRYPDIRLVYWAGGNPFHHHQDLNRLQRAWARPETVIVNEQFWNSLARRADIVLPITTSLEREDIGGAPSDDHLFWMPALIEPVGEARDDYAVFADLAARLGFGSRFTEGRDPSGWIRHMYEEYRVHNPEAPDWEGFVEAGYIRLPPDPAARRILLRDFREDPERHPLSTPSGRIEIHSETIESFGYDDCPPHPSWLEPTEWLGGDISRHPIHLISHQPTTRLHGQWDHGATSLASKIQGREPMQINPVDAASRGIEDGTVVRVFNDRGACLAGAVVTDGVRPGVVVLPTGAWFDPLDPAVPGSMCVHGNPNVLTRDAGTSRLAQGPSAHTCLVEVEPYEEPLPPIRVHTPPPGIGQEGTGTDSGSQTPVAR